MNLAVLRSGESKKLYIQKSYRKDGKSTSKHVACLGDLHTLMKEKKMSEEEVLAWGRKIAREYTENEKKENEIVVRLFPSALIEKDKRRSYSAGYLFLQKMYHEMHLSNVFRNIKKRHHYEYDLDAIFSDLVYARTLEPGSKLSSYETAKGFLEAPKYELHDVYRALSILAQESEYIQSELYRNSNMILSRDRKILYYDCTNYYFEIEEEDENGLRRYGKSKEHRPSPIVQMGLFMDSKGIPLAFSLFNGNENEQRSLLPLEETVIRDFGLEKVVVCTDAGLSSRDNRFFNNTADKAYITTQPLKKLKKEEKEWALEDSDWFSLKDGERVKGSVKDLKDKGNTFYKEDPYPLKGISGQRLIVTYSHKYASYQKEIRERQIARAKKILQSGKGKGSRNPNDPRRFITRTSVTENGEAAEEDTYSLDEERIAEEEKYDGLYGIVTNLEDDAREIIKVAEGRWEIEECFRIMKTDFRARPVYLSRKDRIKAHFLTCFTALFFLRLLEYKTGYRYTANELIGTLRSYSLLKIDEGYLPSYTRTELTDHLHEIFHFRTDYQIIPPAKMRSIIKSTKTRNKG